jgi:cytochrome c nitrite reductase small subunit
MSAFPWTLTAVAAGTVLGLGAYTFDYAEGTSYLSNDPRACVNCHIMRDQYDGWQKGSHKAVATCNDCHVPKNLFFKYLTKAEQGYRHSKGFTFQDFHEPIQTTISSKKVLQENCLRCHGVLFEDESSLEPHGSSNEGINCLHCHRGVGHDATE